MIYMDSWLNVALSYYSNFRLVVKNNLVYIVNYSTFV